MTLSSDNKPEISKAEILTVIALVLLGLVLAILSFTILVMEYTVLNFGDSDLPPYQPDTPLEKHWDAVWYTVTYGAGLLWLSVFIYGIAILFRVIRRRVA
jgi:hypothetical protein